MAGEIAQEAAVVLALGGAAIGAGGSVLAQIVAGMIASRRENKKTSAEYQRWQAESDAKRRDRNFDRKVELFSSFLASAQAMVQAASLGPSEVYVAVLDDSKAQPLEGLHEAVEEIGILAPDVYQHVQSTYAALLKMHFRLIRVDPQRDEIANILAIDAAAKESRFWISHTRVAVRSYMNHEAVKWPEQEIADFMQAFSGKDPRSASSA